MMRLVQSGLEQDRDLFIFYLIHEDFDGVLCQALGPEPCIVAYAEGKPEETLDSAVACAKRLADFERVRRLCLVGYSLGCSGVRARLLEENTSLESLAVIVVVDGTHASKPPEDWQIEVWRRQFARARSGEILVLATHTMNTYVEHLKDPYLATVTVLRLVTGWPLDRTGPVDAPHETSDGNLHVFSYESRSCDPEAHRLQREIALPDLLTRFVRPYLDEGDVQRVDSARAT